jgi:hypothetical protein
MAKGNKSQEDTSDSNAVPPNGKAPVGRSRPTGASAPEELCILGGNRTATLQSLQLLLGLFEFCLEFGVFPLELLHAGQFPLELLLNPTPFSRADAYVSLRIF